MNDITQHFQILNFPTTVQLYDLKGKLIVEGPKPYDPVSVSELMDNLLNSDILKEKCYNWMFRNVLNYEHNDEIDLTLMVEGCADEFSLSGYLDDPDHWLWELADQIVNRINQNC
jgi:hypothetical protein